MKTYYSKKHKFNPLISVFLVFFLLFTIYSSFLLHNQFSVLESTEAQIAGQTTGPLYRRQRKAVNEVIEISLRNGDIDDVKFYIDDQFFTLEEFVEKVNSDQDFASSDYVKNFLYRFQNS